MGKISITCINNQNVSATFDFTQFAPFHLTDISGIYDVNSEVTTSQNTTIDGSTYQGAVAKERNIVISLEMDQNYKDCRSYLYRLFKIKSMGLLIYREDKEAKQIEYAVESITIDKIGAIRRATISLKCPNPYFVDLYDTEIGMAYWVDNFTFPVQFSQQGMEFGFKKADFVKVIENDSGTSDIGLTVVFKADGQVSNPMLHQRETNEFIKIGSLEYPFTMQSGEYVVIVTKVGKKNAYKIQDVTEANINSFTDSYGIIDWQKVIEAYGKEINEYVNEDSSYLQLQDANNTFTYSAEEGVSFLSAYIYYRNMYLGV